MKLSAMTATTAVCFLLLTTVVQLARGEDDEECDDFECPASDGSFADPCTCRRYYTCVGHFPYRSNCPSGLYWDDVRKYCTYKDEAVCGPVAATPAPVTTEAPDKADTCDTSECQLPYCHCSTDGTLIPGGLTKEETPQMVLLMLDGAVNTNNYLYYKRLFRGRTNPNKCDVKGTFFITHHYSDYYQIQKLRSKGHEFAVGSISDDKDLSLKNYTAWVNEMVGMREILNKQVDIRTDEIYGARAPGLRPGHNQQYEMMTDYGFVWDSSVGVPPLDTPVWPYTLDYRIPHKCKGDSCPTRKFPGLWEIPLNSHHVEDFTAGHCPYIDQCVFSHMDRDDIFNWLEEDFNRHYKTNKAPYVLAMHTNWFNNIEQVKALEQFMNYTETLDDVYYVTATQALLWITSPVKLSDLDESGLWDCPESSLPPLLCNNQNTCALPHKDEKGIESTKYMATCKTCPPRYPWLTNTRGRATDEKDVYPKYNGEQ